VHVTDLGLDGPRRVIDLSQPLEVGMPCSPTHPGFEMSIEVAHGDVLRSDGITGSHEKVTFGDHVGTHVDALCHVAVDGAIFPGVPVADAVADGRYVVGGIEQMPPYVGRAVFYDVPRLLGRPMNPGEAVTREHLEALGDQGDPSHGEAVLVRTGWGARWPGADYARPQDGIPGLDLDAARYLSNRGVVLVGADTIAVEQVTAEHGLRRLPVHRHLLGERGIHLLESADLEPLSDVTGAAVLLVCAPLKIVGATGAPVRPLAIIDQGA